MKLQFKPILWLVAGILVMFSVSLALEIHRNVRVLRQLSADNLARLQQGEWAKVHSVFTTLENGVKGSLERGEMEKFVRLLTSQTNLNGLLEFSLFNRRGVVSHSSDAQFLQKTLPSDLSDQLQNKPDQVARLSTDAFEIYQPQRLTSDCLRCHTDWKSGGSGGVLLCRFSTRGLREAETQLAQTIRNVQRRQSIIGILTTAVIAGLFAVLATIVVQRQIAAPLARAIDHLTGTADELQSSSNQISTASHSLAEGASTQAASLEETSASLEELSAMTTHNTNSAQGAADTASKARQAAETGTTHVQALDQAVHAIQTSSSNVARILKTIDQIAFQTNILALNAAVEAARAGQAGLGFGVVADEVRALAQRSAQAAKETAQMIHESIEASQRGVDIGTQVTRSFQEIAENVRRVDTLVAEIAAASKEQSQGITQITTAIRQMDQVTQSNAAGAEETASASAMLKTQAGALRLAMDELEHLMGGQTAQPTRTPPQKPPHTAPPTTPRTMSPTPGMHGASPQPPTRPRKTAREAASHSLSV